MQKCYQSKLCNTFKQVKNNRAIDNEYVCAFNLYYSQGWKTS